MNTSRRQLLGAGGAAAAALAFPRIVRAVSKVVEIGMTANASGTRVRFDPIGLFVEPGWTIRWLNMDDGNSHTATAYHPSILDHTRRIPKEAAPFDSDYLLPGEDFSITLSEPGIYDYYCVPHEHAGMVGRIIVGDIGWKDVPAKFSTPYSDARVPEIALATFPSIEEIMTRRVVSGA